MTQIDMQRQTYLTTAKCETAARHRVATGPDGSVDLAFLQLESAISGLILPAVLHVWPRPATRLNDPNRHATQNVPNK